MSSSLLTQKEAEELIKMIKNTLEERIAFPSNGSKKEFDVIGDNKKDIFTIHIFKSSKNNYKYNFCARVKINNISLLELHINPNGRHTNPDGEIIYGNHWHIYTEKYGRKFAFHADNIEDENFIDNTLKFLDKFNVIKKPTIAQQFILIK